MKNVYPTTIRNLIVPFAFAAFVFASLISPASAQNYVPTQSYQPPRYNPPPQYNRIPQYNSLPQYNSVPQYNTVPQYNSVQPYNSVPASALKNYRVVPNATQPTVQPYWTSKLTENTKREHDFGIVAMASKQIHQFDFVNTTGADLFLSNVRVSCGCTIPKILTAHVKPGETASVTAQFDTRKFYGKRGATVTVSIQKSGTTSEFGELQFAVKGEIRRDVVCDPGEVVFANVKLAEETKRTVRVKYAGSSAWAITQVKSTNPNITAVAQEVERNPQTGRVSYDLIVNMNGQQPAGAIYDHLTIVTNDTKTSGMPITVKGKISPQIEVLPINLGVINKDQKIKKKLILHSTSAFAVKEIKTLDPRIKFEKSDGEKTLHILTYTLDTSTAGQIDEQVTILTSDPNQPKTTVPFSVQIVPATMAESKK